MDAGVRKRGRPLRQGIARSRRARPRIADRADLQAEPMVGSSVRCCWPRGRGPARRGRADATRRKRFRRMAAWGTCSTVSCRCAPTLSGWTKSRPRWGAAAEEQPAGLDDEQGKPRLIRSGPGACPTGRIGDRETASDQALTAARRAGEHRRANAASAEHAARPALRGPNPVPRAGGVRLDVVPAPSHHDGIAGRRGDVNRDAKAY